MKIELNISELFAAVSELENIVFEHEKEYYQKSEIKIQDENGKYQYVPFLITKTDTINILEFDDGSKVETAAKHKMAYDTNNCKMVSEFNSGDIIKKADGSIVTVIKNYIDNQNETVFDLSIDTKTHLYQDSQGFIHHNTAHMTQVADNLDLHFIHIDVATLTKESTTGIPKAEQVIGDDGKPAKDQNGNPVMKTDFSKPELLIMIENMMEEAIKEDSIFPESERKKGKGKYKFLLLFDELTRADAQVFNSIRKVLLEKSFNEKYDLPSSIMVVGALNPEDEGVGELTKHTRDVVDVIPSRASWAKTESYLLGQERPTGLQEALGFDCNSSTVGALKAVLSHYQSRDNDWRGNPVISEERLFNIKDGGNIIYVSPRELTDIVSMTNSNILNRLTKLGVVGKMDTKVDNAVNELSDDDFVAAMMASEDKNDDETKKGIFNKRSRYSEEDFDIFINAMVVELRDVWANKLSFTCKKQDIDPANFLSVTTGFIMKNNLVRDQYETIKSLEVQGVKSMGEMFAVYYDDPNELYDSPHFDNYLTANFTAPQKFVQEITDFIADKVAEIQQGSGMKPVEFINALGDKAEMPEIAAKSLELYFKYLEYVRVILKILTKKSEYAGQVREAERTGQYLGNLYTSLQQVGRNFMSTQNLVEFFAKNRNMDPKNVERGRKITADIRTILADFGFKVEGQ